MTLGDIVKLCIYPTKHNIQTTYNSLVLYTTTYFGWLDQPSKGRCRIPEKKHIWTAALLVCFWNNIFINHNTFGDQISVEVKFSALVQSGPGAHPTSSTMGTGSFPGVKRLGRGADDPPPSSAEDEERVGQYLYTFSGPSLPVVGQALLPSL